MIVNIDKKIFCGVKKWAGWEKEFRFLAHFFGVPESFFVGVMWGYNVEGF